MNSNHNKMNSKQQQQQTENLRKEDTELRGNWGSSSIPHQTPPPPAAFTMESEPISDSTTVYYPPLHQDPVYLPSEPISDRSRPPQPPQPQSNAMDLDEKEKDAVIASINARFEPMESALDKLKEDLIGIRNMSNNPKYKQCQQYQQQQQQQQQQDKPQKSRKRDRASFES